ncbi:MAG: histidine kinase dimerization/phospho-acceptor domain-containing protein [Salinibacter sp.]
MTTDFDEPETEEELHEVISSVYHDLNNPLSIIAGNAQFLVELSQEEELDEQFLSSAQDIQEAAQQMSESLQRLTRLKERLKEEKTQ